MIDETIDYWLFDNKIIFKPKFNSSLGTYDELLSQCNELVFSNYDDVLICIETDNKFINKYRKNYASMYWMGNIHEYQNSRYKYTNYYNK